MTFTRRAFLASSVAVVAVAALSAPVSIPELVETGFSFPLPTMDPNEVYTFSAYLKQAGWVSFGEPNAKGVDSVRGVWEGWEFDPPLKLENEVRGDWNWVSVTGSGRDLAKLRIGSEGSEPGYLHHVMLEKTQSALPANLQASRTNLFLNNDSVELT